MKAFLILALITTVSTRILAQQEVIVWNERHLLQWKDFTGNIKDSSAFDAESFAEVRYNYKLFGSGKFFFEVFANFNKKISWSRKEYQSKDLLKHEQLHFNIAGLYAAKLKKAFDEYEYSDNYANEIQEIFNQKKLEYHAMQNKYDEETNHSLDKEKQKQWENFIATELNGLKNNYDYAKK